jgi:hypothetical protein
MRWEEGVGIVGVDLAEFKMISWWEARLTSNDVRTG